MCCAGRAEWTAVLAGVPSGEGWVGRAGGGLSVGPATVRPAPRLDTAQQGCPSLLNCAPQGSRLLLQPLRLPADLRPPAPSFCPFKGGVASGQRSVPRMCPRCEAALPWQQWQRTAALPGDLQLRVPGRCLRCLPLLTVRLVGFLLTLWRALSCEGSLPATLNTSPK